jgi:hypothetical protein
LPTPDEPTNATVRPGPIQGAIRLAAVPSRASSGSAISPRANRSASRACSAPPPGEIGLGQKQHGLGSRLGGERQVALDPRRVEIGVARSDDEQRIDIGGDQLRFGPGSGRPPREERAPLEAAHETAALGQHPIARGETARGMGMARLEAEGPLGRDQVEPRPVHRSNPGRRQRKLGKIELR